MNKEYLKRKNRIRKVKAKSITVTYDLINSKVFLYEDGILIGDTKFTIDRKSKNMWISDFNIYDLYQDKGYGSLLARTVIDLAKLYHLKTITLTDGSSLEGFWQRLGFIECNRLKRGTYRLVLK